MIREFFSAKTSTPRCDHVLVDKETIAWRKRDKRDIRCGNSSRYQIRDKNYCGKHAGMVAVQILLENSK